MKIFVTGGAGFIGSQLCEHMHARGDRVTAYDNLSLGRREFLSSLEGKAGFEFIHDDLLRDKRLPLALAGADVVFHLAANSDISLGSERTDLDLQQSVLATYRLLEAMRVHKVKRLVFASTSAVYGEASVKPTPEHYGPLIPISFYGAGKLGAEALISAYAHHYGVQAFVFRFANVVGPRLTHGAIHDFVARLRQTPDRLEVLGNGRQRKSYLHVEDCISGMLFGLERGTAEFNLFNLSGPGVTEVRFIAEEVVRQMGGRAQIVYGQSDRGWKGDVPNTWLDDSKLKKLGWSACISSDDAVKRSVGEALACPIKP